MSDSRIKNSKRNIFNGLIRQVMTILLAFTTRTMILFLLGEEYLGLSSLFTSILAVLNLAELGFNTAVVYFLYKPIAEKDTPAICAIISYLRKIYNLIGTVILVAGLGVMPFLPNLISGEITVDINIYLLYVIYLANTVVSYWCFAYKAVVFTAVQRADVVDKIYSATSLGVKVAQLLVLLLFRDYYLFAAVMTAGTLINNLLLQYFSRRQLPDMVPRGTISPQTKADLNRQVRSLFVGRVGDLTRNSFGSIFLSAMLGLTVVAAYDNYLYIYNSVIGIVWMIGNAVQASVGNSMVSESLEKNRKDFLRFDFLFGWFNSWCTVCLCCLYQPFVYIWMNGNRAMMLSDLNMVLLSLYFYSVAIGNVRNIYVNGAGLFTHLRVWYVVETVVNILLNLLLGYFFGVTGVILATMLTVVLFNYIARSNVLFKNYFKSPVRVYYGRHLLYFAVTIVAAAVTNYLCLRVGDDGILGLVIRIGICGVVPNLVFLLAYCRTSYFADCITLVKKILRRE